MDPPAPFGPNATRRVRHTVRVGVGVLVLDENNRIYAGFRKGSHGAGLLALPGGHLEMYETWEECAAREVFEEMNLELYEVKFVHVTNDMMPDEEKHYVTIFMTGKRVDPTKEPTNTEPRKCDGWVSYSLQELKVYSDSGQLFGPLQKLIQEQPKALLELLGK